jgi:hypothetical protein
MPKEDETLAAILAEMRAAAKSTDLFDGEEVGEPLIRGTKVEEWADRIEAAAEWKRNAAAMRGALSKFLDLSRRGLAFFTSYRYTEAENDEIEAAFDEAKSALAAPARNCDRFATEDEAREAYWAYREPLEFNNKPFVAITEWLFAPAEGGEK